MISIQPEFCSAGDIAGLTPLPQDSRFQYETTQSSNILTALLYENLQLYEKAGKIWKSLPDDSLEVQDHLFFTELASTFDLNDTEIPRTDRSLILMSRYLSWNRKWQQALELLESSGKQFSSIEYNLERIRLNLVLGRYERAEELVKRLGKMSHREQMQVEILTIWRLILTGEREQAQITILKLEDNYLYLPLPAILPEGFLSNQGRQKSLMMTSLLRFPSSTTLIEQLVKLFLDTGDWDALNRLVYSQQFLEITLFDSILLAEIYLHTGQDKKLDAILKSTSVQTTGPEYYDLLARTAIKQKNWELLLKVSNVYQSIYPQLMDGKLYLAIYFQEIGRSDKSQELLQQAGL